MTTELAIKKTLGWVFIAIGIIMMAYIILTTMNCFLGTTPFPELFYGTEEVLKTGASDSLNDLMQSMLSDQLNSFISKDSILLLLNMSAWSLFAFFMIFAGAKVFELGLKLMKE
ncbi:MAG TPA: hypothetical protein PKU93_01225 [Candidatus Pacearchaeota archaeon]|nr:hypothetical protein [Candidatus Pacearchaeota archaeon]